MIKTTLKKTSLTVAISTVTLSSQILFAADVEISLSDEGSTLIVEQPVGTELVRSIRDHKVGIGT